MGEATVVNEEFIVRIGSALIALILAGCVNINPETGRPTPRSGQKYEFATVEHQAEQLQDGMARLEVLMLLGSPAEKSADDNIWVYLPERPAWLLPSRSLRLVFKNDLLVEHGYSTVVLGQPL